MPLIILCGSPCSGKTFTGRKLQEYFTAKGKTCVVVSDEDLLNSHGRNKLFSESVREKDVRGSLKASAIRHLDAETLVILDSVNYIKGFRYELYCLSKEHKTTHCIVECSGTHEELLRRNALREESKQYSEAIIQALLARYEAPDSRNRWDSPLIVVQGDTIPFEDVDKALFNRAAPPANLSTQSQPLAETNYLHVMDNKTRDIVTYIVKSQQAGQLTDISFPGSKLKLSLNRELTTAQLNKLRRQFISYTKMHPVASEEQIVATFIQYLNSNLMD